MPEQIVCVIYLCQTAVPSDCGWPQRRCIEAAGAATGARDGLPASDGTDRQGYPFATRALVVSLLINPLEHELGAPTTGELASFLAHDLRTPLNAVRGFAELLLSGSAGPLTGEMIGLLADIGRAGRTLERAVLCAQELGEPCIMAGASTRSSMRSLLVDAGF
ncbi:MAG: histidine kinase dimerization/phospho-acceptor domain-containing protein, partial [Geminicoccaceae bacterium]